MENGRGRETKGKERRRGKGRGHPSWKGMLLHGAQRGWTPLGTRTYFMVVIDGVFCLDASTIAKLETLSVVTFEWSEALITLQTLQ